MQQPIFISGIGTDVGKTIISAIVTEALQANYWKPIQAGFEAGTDAQQVQFLLSNKKSVVFPEVYRLQMPASPHIAAREEGIDIAINAIEQQTIQYLNYQQTLVIEGAGGLFVPLNSHSFVIDLIEKLNAKVILVSRNYLGSINHSLLAAAACKQRNLDVIGWIFNDSYGNYETEIAKWSGYKHIASIPYANQLSPQFIQTQAAFLQPLLLKAL